MLRWLARLLPRAEPQPIRLSLRVTALENRADDTDSRLEYLSSELRSLRGRVYNLKKSAQDDPGETIDEQPAAEPAGRPVTSTAHLARRFRVG